MSKEIKALKALVERLERTYNDALQTEGELQISYTEGVLDGVKMAVEEIENLEEA